ITRGRVGGCNQLVVSAAYASAYRCRSGCILNDKPITRGRPAPRFPGTIERGLLDIRPAVLRAERVAVAAFVAEIGVAGDLHWFRDFEAAQRAGPHRTALLDDHIVIVERDHGRWIREIRRVGTDGQAFVARDAVERHELR